MEERKEKDLYIKYGKKGYWAREYKKSDPEQKNDKGKVVGIMRLMGGILHRTRLVFKVKI